MMPGVEVLNQYAVTSAGPGELVFGLVFTIAGLILICSGIGMLISRSHEDVIPFLFVFGLFMVGIGVFGGIRAYYTRTSYVEYQVTISDSVSMNEFTTKYQVIRQDGRIYTIRER